MNRYTFRRFWRMPAPPDEVFEVLHDLDAWTDWWPEVRASRRRGDDAAEVTIRSFLPYDLHMTLTRRVDDPRRRLLEASITGDLEGFARFELRAAPYGTLMRYDQEVEVRKPLMRRLAVLARPLFIANHAAMMRSGERGLRAYVSRRDPAAGR